VVPDDLMLLAARLRVADVDGVSHAGIASGGATLTMPMTVAVRSGGEYVLLGGQGMTVAY
jgi:hypothetical protein